VSSVATQLGREDHLTFMSVVNETVPSDAPQRLSTVLFDSGDRSFSSLASLPSNVEAIEAGLLFAAGLSGFVAITGPTGWGKSHLLGVVSRRLRKDEREAPEPLVASDAVANSGLLDTPRPLILDDVQDVMNKPRLKMLLSMGLDRRMRQGRRTMLAFTLPKPTRAMRSLLPNPREWKIAVMGAAEPAERVLLLNQLSATEGLMLSPRLVRVMATQMHGNGRTLAGALKRLRLSGTDWLDSCATVRACGLLAPFFSDNSEWDLEHRILRVAEANRNRFPRVNHIDLALHVMLHSASLNEVHVARSANVEPSEAYGRAGRFRALAEQEPALRGHVSQFVDIVVEALADEA
jgi:hypothetical protein